MAELENFETAPDFGPITSATQAPAPKSSDEDQLDPALVKRFNGAFDAMDAAQQGHPQAAPPQPQQQSSFRLSDYGIPDPVKEPGSYSPEQEQMALSVAGEIADPEMRMRTMSRVKQEFANQRIIDGVAGQRRESDANRATGDYLHAMKVIRDKNIPWPETQKLVTAAIDAMWKDPRLQFGNTAETLQHHMEEMMGIKDQTKVGSGYQKMLDGLDSGEIRQAGQILHMEAQGLLTPAGANEGISRLNAIGRGDQNAKIVNQLEAVALEHMKREAYGKFDETAAIAGQKPGPRQLDKQEDMTRALLLQIQGAGGDIEKVKKVTSRENLDALAEQIYPKDQRYYDYVTQGAGGAGPINIPPTVAGDDRSQNEARWILGAPPTAKDPRTGQLKTTNIAGWTKAVEALRSGQTTVQEFNKAFPDKDGAHILKVLPYVAQTAPAGAVAAPPVVEPSEGIAEQFMQWRGQELQWLWSHLGGATAPAPAEAKK
jgi:hypothetical protein